MARWISILVTLLAQVVAVPTCFVRCVGTDGHVCVELVGQDCHSCESEPACDALSHGACTHDAQACRAAKSQLQDDDDSGLNLTDDGCGCRHSLLEATPGVATKATAPPVRFGETSEFAISARFCLSPVVLPAESFGARGARPSLDTHLVALATIVLRV